jgi:transposase-like protein
MTCPHCQSRKIRKLDRTTDLRYAVFHCGDCRRKSNERTGTPFNYLEFPTVILGNRISARLGEQCEGKLMRGGMGLQC